MCKILDICVYIKEGNDGRGGGGSGAGTTSVCGVAAGWMKAARGSGHHLIKTVAAHLRQLDSVCLRLWVGVATNGGLGLCLCEN